MSSALLDSGLYALEFSRRTTLAFVEDIPEERWCHQPIPNANHAMWVLGHLVSTDDYFLSQIAGRPPQIPDNWNELFGMGSKPTGQLADYPKPAEVRDRMSSRRSDLLAWLRSLNDDQLVKTMPQELQEFCPTFAALPGAMAWHEGLHAGQLTIVRKSLGFAPKFG